jgi:Na+/proline symporter
MLVTAMLLLGGAATIEAMTGLSVYVAAFLIPLGIITYTFADGLAATFLSNYLHTIILHAVLLIFVVAVYLFPMPGGRSQLGSISDVYERLTRLNSYSAEECIARGFISDPTGASGATACGPVSGNRAGSSLTMFSQGGMMFAIINLIGNFGTVFVGRYVVTLEGGREGGTDGGREGEDITNSMLFSPI